MATTVDWNRYPNSPPILKDYEEEEAELLSELEVHQLACKRNFRDAKSWMKWALALKELAYIQPVKSNTKRIHYLRDAKCKLEKALLIKEDYYEAMYELGMAHYEMLWDKSLKVHGDAFMEHCHIATDLFKEVQDKAPDVYIEDMLELVRQQMPSKLKEGYDDDDDEIDNRVGTSSSFKRKMIEEALNLVVEKLALDPDDFVSKMKVVDALHRLPIRDPNGG